ncbi:Inherit from COG: Catalyzes the reversible transfer of the terminal phosphate group between ATP and AMP. Plays an important role in cellular energy homeostasis and in adenine nucleotide metabolism (By similarity) [Seminavis robusta]|uniref:Adenylate kinase n=1 Tax=Seminavis robusta TaxID=568900 RepID=A0A9N8F317_9STRA|nr:Inherit from COG: Catalyzes the reversible transfer of the terminal phosphate group between ATP and AMP. Plays an important role in cellular energy homeostasis and in adenine nucleotide metabolism (By similarity) [Seminavis robusta]|eukprot:Sro2949_g340860.1 Inherit from COG: Catalyzes the reversible transfer of the terminal phosphate group between ATP and AMP. Plays an important role in cellular energy homeostasis and in adenine nucleotide metabolism (By similarity) (196) ;mRNA; f:425-1012
MKSPLLLRYPTIIVFGNSGSGKSTLARNLVSKHPEWPHLDLDSIAWCHKDDQSVPKRKPHHIATQELDRWIMAQQQRKPPELWIMEGCYADLLSHVAPKATLTIFLNLPILTCQENAKARPWEPHKYPHGKQDQDANLPMLLDWIADYEHRSKDSDFSKHAHQALFDSFDGKKLEITSNWSPQDYSIEQTLLSLN